MSAIDKLLGRPLATSEESDEKIGVVAGVPTLGLDGLSSSAYGPEAALAILLPLGLVSLHYIVPLTLVILAVLGILYLSYRQTIPAYPNGGGSFTVAKENLGVRFGLLAAAALMLDYTLNVAVGISSGIGQLVSAVPSLHKYTLSLCLTTLAIIALVNLRGARESGALFALPTYLFIGAGLVVVALGLLRGPHPHPVIAPPPVPAATAAVSVWLLLRAFASGCTAMTGVEAVSNGVNAFADPSIRNAQRTLTAIVGTLALLLAGIALLCHNYQIDAMDESKSGYQSVISQLVAAVVGRGIAYYVTIGATLIVVVLSANTSFVGFPRLCRLIALDDYLPHGFALLGRRLVYTVGITFLTGLAGLLLAAFKGITDDLIPLFAVGAFLAFTLSQAGMVMHWRRNAGSSSQDKVKTRTSLAINAAGAVTTGIALAIILVAKFTAGAWITLVIIPSLFGIFLAIKRHYDTVDRQVRIPCRLDLSHNEPPVVVVPIEGWNLLTERALRFAMRLSPDVIAVHAELPDPRDPDETQRRKVTAELQQTWQTDVVAPARQAGLQEPKLEILSSPYRKVFGPLSKYLKKIQPDYPDRLIAVIIPELVETHWWEWLLHNHRATALKANLLLMRDQKVVVINVPWYLGDAPGMPGVIAAAPTETGASRT